MTSPEFFYFDLGNVLVFFSLERMFRQMAAVAGTDPEAVRRALFDDGLEGRYELGQVTGREFHEGFCQRTGTRPDYDALEAAANDIFTLNATMLPVVAQLGRAGCRLGILSNTCESHWQYCRRRFRIVGDGFSVHALSCRLGAVKPGPEIFQQAAALAGCRPDEIFFADDLPQHVEGARQVGFDAVQYTSTRQLVTDLRRRGVRFDY